MRSDRNFNIRREYVEELPRRRNVPNRDDEELQNMFDSVLRVLGPCVVILFAVVLLAAIVGWMWSFTLKPQTLTERSEHEHIQEAGRNGTDTTGRERSSSPPAGRAEERKEETAEAGVVLNEKGATAPVFKWVCEDEKILCGLKDQNGRWVQSFGLENGQILASEIFLDAIRPRSWSCQTGGPKTTMYCTVQDSNGQFLSGVLHDGKTVKEFHADPNQMEYGTFDYAGVFPEDGSLSRGGPDWIPRKDLVYGANLPNHCSRVRFKIPVRRTASVYAAATGRTSLDTLYGPTALVLSEGFCLDAGALHVCIVCGSSNSLP